MTKGVGSPSPPGLPSFGHSSAPGHRGFLQTLSPVDLWLPAPTATEYLWAGQSLKIQIDGERLEKILKKVVRGLYFHVTGKRLPVQYGVHVHPVGNGIVMLMKDATPAEVVAVAPADGQPTVLGPGSVSRVLSFVPGDRSPAGSHGDIQAR